MTSTPNAPTPVLGYLRVSTAGQAASGIGEAAQRNSIEVAAAVNGYAVVGWAIDAGKSGAGPLAKRPALAEARRALAAGEVGGLVAAKVDRLGRSYETMQLVEDARQQGWRLIALDVGADTATASGELVVSMLVTTGRFEWRRISERQVEKFAELRRQGRARGRAAVPREVADRIIAMSDAGQTLRAIGAVLEAEGVPTAQGGARWWAGTVRSAIVTRRSELDAQAAA